MTNFGRGLICSLFHVRRSKCIFGSLTVRMVALLCVLLLLLAFALGLASAAKIPIASLVRDAFCGRLGAQRQMLVRGWALSACVLVCLSWLGLLDGQVCSTSGICRVLGPLSSRVLVLCLLLTTLVFALWTVLAARVPIAVLVGDAFRGKQGAQRKRLAQSWALTACWQGASKRGAQGRFLVLLLVLLLAMVLLQLLSQATLLSVGNLRGPEADGTFADAADSGGGSHVGGDSAAQGPDRTAGWVAALDLLRSSRTRYVVVDVKNGLGNRMRALASAMAVANRLGRPVLLIWVPDLHCNCSFLRLFAGPLRFVLLEEDLPRQNLTEREFQIYNYMRPEPGAVKDAPVQADPRRHLYFKSGFIMNHPYGKWKHAQRFMQLLTPTAEISSRIVADKSMVGLHIRNIFDAPRDEKTNTSALGKEAVASAAKEYGEEGTRQLMQWRQASHWTNFVPRIIALLRESGLQHPSGMVQKPLRFYLAADSEEAYSGLVKRFPHRLLYTARQCSTERCDFRDCTGMIFSLIDMLNLAQTRLILGSGWSSYSEVAAFIGGVDGKPVPILMAGRDFGALVDQRSERFGPKPPCCNNAEASTAVEDSDEERGDAIQHYWPKPF